MGQTLTHGVYLPDEGERNCYSGLAANWQILDNSVGTVAEHTSALAGKAPLVHTHTKSDITDFPAYGNAAGTICEGNDSRLSDARPPVAHTHTKSDITDLFNSANTWGGTNSFNIGNLEVQTEYTLGTLPQAESAVALFTGRATDNNFVTNINFYQNPTRGTGLRFTIRNKWDNNGYSTTGTTRNAHIEFLQNIDKTAYLQWQGYINNSLYPLANNTYDLGTSTNKWKSLNGINPGALSLPSTATADVSGDIVPPSGESSINLSGSANKYTPSNNGWLTLAINNASGNCIIARQNTSARDTLNYMQGYAPGQTNIYLTIPVLAGVTYYIFLYATSFVMARFALCQGNV